MFGKSRKQPESVPFDELLNRRRKIDLEIADRQETEVESLKTKIHAVTDALGITVAELFGIKGEAEPRRRKPTPKVKYRDPERPENTWTGKGKQPKWLQEKIEQGASKDQFLAQ